MGLESLEKVITPRKNKFSNWVAPLNITEAEVEELMLVYGVANTEGTMKGKEINSAENVIFATGAMAASAFFGMARIDVDHFAKPEDVPKEYIEKYGEDFISEWPPAYILDAQASKNVVDGSDKELYQSEFIGFCVNRTVYNLIKEGKVKACSVVDYLRRDDCDKCNTPDCTCTLEGSKYIENTFILEYVPNSDGTWVAAVTKDNIADLLVSSDEATVESLKNKLNSFRDKQLHAKKQNDTGDLAEYYADGDWLKGKESLISFLKDKKEIDEAKIEELADYILEHPDDLNEYQLEHLSGMDLLSWYNSTQSTFNAAKIKRNLAIKNYMLKNAKDLAELKKTDKVMTNFDPFGKSETNYGDKELGKQCGDCRFFTGYYDGEGYCAIVAGDIQKDKGCDKFDPAPGGNADTGESKQTDTETNPEEPTVNADDDPVMPDEDGKCPAGYTPNEDGTECVKTPMDDDPEEMARPNTLKELMAKARPNPKAVIEENPSKNKANEELDIAIDFIKSQIAEYEVILPGRDAMRDQTRLESLRVELKRLESLKKN